MVWRGGYKKIFAGGGIWYFGNISKKGAWQERVGEKLEGGCDSQRNYDKVSLARCVQILNIQFCCLQNKPKFCTNFVQILRWMASTKYAKLQNFAKDFLKIFQIT